MIELKINNFEVSVPEGTTILDAAKKLDIRIPTLCYHADLCIAGNCRVCLVEQKNAKILVAACATPVFEGMEIFTHTLKVRMARKHVIELLLSEHRTDCTKCYKNGSCELQNLANEYRVEEKTFLDLSIGKDVDRSSPAIEKDDSKCIRCQRCVRTCAELQHVSALTVAHRGDKMAIETFMDKPLYEVICTYCGQCVNRCPTGALVERNYIEEVWEAIDNPEKHVVVQTAPAVRVSLGEELGYDVGERVTGKLVTVLKRLGFDKVFDTQFSADLTIVEEGTELLTRLKKVLLLKEDNHIPMFTSCSPGWIKYIEHQFPGLLPHLSTCKSPQQMFGPLAKTYYAQKAGIDPQNIVVVSIMPCTAKKFEAERPEMRASGYQDVDYVLTTRELAKMIKQAGEDFLKLADSEYDSLLGVSTGAGVIFGATGGVMEAALRTAYEIVTGRDVPFDNLNITPVRGTGGIREATIKITGCKEEWSFLEDVDLQVAVTQGLANARILMKQAKEGKSPYHFIEVMACLGGCLGGGGQPIPTNLEIRLKRKAAVYAEDESKEIRKSHENPEIIKLYDDFLGEPNGHKAHELLHTDYTTREQV